MKILPGSEEVNHPKIHQFSLNPCTKMAENYTPLSRTLKKPHSTSSHLPSQKYPHHLSPNTTAISSLHLGFRGESCLSARKRRRLNCGENGPGDIGSCVPMWRNWELTRIPCRWRFDAVTHQGGEDPRGWTWAILDWSCNDPVSGGQMIQPPTWSTGACEFEANYRPIFDIAGLSGRQ